MGVVRWPREDRDEAMVVLGGTIAACLIENDPGHPDHGGWQGALQTAADLTRDDPVVLTIADEIHQASWEFQRPEFVRGYAMATMFVYPTGPGHWLLAGMLEHLDHHDADGDPRAGA